MEIDLTSILIEVQTAPEKNQCSGLGFARTMKRSLEETQDSKLSYGSERGRYFLQEGLFGKQSLW